MFASASVCHSQCTGPAKPLCHIDGSEATLGHRDRRRWWKPKKQPDHHKNVLKFSRLQTKSISLPSRPLDLLGWTGLSEIIGVDTSQRLALKEAVKRPQSEGSEKSDSIRQFHSISFSIQIYVSIALFDRRRAM